MRTSPRTSRTKRCLLLVAIATAGPILVLLVRPELPFVLLWPWLQQRIQGEGHRVDFDAVTARNPLDVRLHGVRIGGGRLGLLRLDVVHLAVGWKTARVEGSRRGGAEGDLDLRLRWAPDAGTDLELRGRKFRIDAFPVLPEEGLAASGMVDGHVRIRSGTASGTSTGSLDLTALRLLHGGGALLEDGRGRLRFDERGWALELDAFLLDLPAAFRAARLARGPAITGRVRGRLQVADDGGETRIETSLRGEGVRIDALRPEEIELRARWSEGEPKVDSLSIVLEHGQGGRLQLRNLPGEGAHRSRIEASLRNFPLVPPLEVQIGGRPLHARVTASAKLDLGPLPDPRPLGKVDLRLGAISLGETPLGSLKTTLRFEREAWILEGLELDPAGEDGLRLEMRGRCDGRGAKATIERARLVWETSAWGHLEAAASGAARLDGPPAAHPQAFLAALFAGEAGGRDWTASIETRDAVVGLDGNDLVRCSGPCIFRAAASGARSLDVSVAGFGGTAEGSGTLAPSPRFRLAWRGLSLQELARRIPSRDVLSLRGTAEGELRVDGEKLGGRLALSTGLELGLWFPTKDGVRSLTLVDGASSWTVAGTTRAPRLSKDGLALTLSESPSTMLLTCRGVPLSWRYEDPARRRGIAAGRMEIDGELGVGDGKASTERLRFSVSATTPSTSLPSRAELTLVERAGDWRLDGLRLLDETGRARLEGSVPLTRASTGAFGLESDGLPMRWLSPLDLPVSDDVLLDVRCRGWLPPLLGEDGLVDALRRHGTRIALESFHLRDAARSVIRLDAPARIDAGPKGLVLEGCALRVGGKRLEATGRIDLETERVELRVLSERIPLPRLLGGTRGRFPVIEGGAIEGEFRLSGPLSAPRPAGRFSLLDLVLSAPPMPDPLRGSVELVGSPDGFRMSGRELRIGKTPVLLETRLPLSNEGFGPLASRLAVEGLDVVTERSRLDAVTATVAVTGTLSPFDLHGELDLALGGGRIHSEKAGLGGLLETAIQAIRAPAPPADAPARARGILDGLSGRLTVTTRKPVELRSGLLEAGLRGRIRYDKLRGGAWMGGGRIEAERARVYVHRSRFDCERASIEGRSGLGWTVDVRAKAEVARHTIRLDVTGKLEGPEVRLAASPPLSEIEILHLLGTGKALGEGSLPAGLGATARDYYLTSAINRALASRFGRTELSLRQLEGAKIVTVDRDLGGRKTLRYSRGTDASESLAVEFRFGATRFEAGRQKEGDGTGTFLGVKRSIRFR